MTTINRITALALVCLPQSWGFAPPKSSNSPYGVRSKRSHLKYNPNDSNAPNQSIIDDVIPFSENESESARKRRMDMVRKLRTALYSGTHPKEDHLKLPNGNAQPKWAYGSSIIHNLPTLTTDDLEEITSNDAKAVLPGHQYVWNIHSSKHSHMFHTILAKDEGPHFFACLSDYDSFSDGPQYATLMRVCDYRFRDEDGRIVLAVQAMDRLRIKKLSSSYISVQTGDFLIWPENELVREKLSGAFPNEQAICDEPQDDECITQNVDPNSVCYAALSACAADSYRCRTFEYAPIYLTEKPKGPDDAHSLHANPNDSKATQLIKEGIKKQEQEETKYEVDYLPVIELVNFDALAYRSLIDASAVNTQAIKNFWTHANSNEQSSFADEEELFAQLANFDDASNAATFTINSNQEDQFPTDFATFANAPSNEGVAMMEYHLWVRLDELIRLINKVSNAPVPLSSQLLALLPRRNDWPEEFVLDEYSKSMLSQTGPVVRIDEITKQNRSSVYDNTGYSSLRRALRLSYSVWLLIDGMAVTGVDPPPPSRTEVLAMETIFERLSVATNTLDQVNGVLKRLIPHIKKNGKDEPEN